VYIRHYPKNQTELDEAIANGAEQWMLDALKGNYSYLGWGNGEDYMCSKDGGWNSPMEEQTVEGLVEQDDLNEVVHGYFFVSRESSKCTACDCTGYNPETRVLSERWYHDPSNNRSSNLWYGRNLYEGWQYDITDDEIEALVRSGRLWDLVPERVRFDDELGSWVRHDGSKWVPCAPPKMPSTDEVNAWARKFIGHDAINRGICVRTRATRLGFYGKCQVCGGDGQVHVEDEAHLGLQLWILHPRKGASRGMVIKDVTEDDIPLIRAYFRTAIERTIARMGGIAGM
jgi:hypothetical protein